MDVEVTIKARWRVCLEADGIPTKRQILKRLQDEDYDDIIDTETLEVESVEKIDLFQTDDELDDEE